jgi:hypothetical protein
MNCPNCHKPIPARARYCIHCGAEQEATPIAAVAAAASTARSRREAANAAHAEAIPEVAPLPASSAAIVELPSAARARDPQVASDPVTRPAYADAPPRRTLAVSLAVACFAVGIVAAATAWWFYSPSTNSADAVTAPAENAAGTPAASSAPREAASPSAAETATEAASGVSSAAAEHANAADVTQARAESPTGVTEAPQAVEIRPLPPARAAARAARPATRAPETPKVATAAQPPTTSAPAPPPASAPPRAPAVAMAPTVAAPVSDRWARMDHELSQCTREDFIARVVCGQRVRFRYCAGYWGKVPACPGSPAVERGQ